MENDSEVDEDEEVLSESSSDSSFKTRKTHNDARRNINSMAGPRAMQKLKQVIRKPKSKPAPKSIHVGHARKKLHS